MFAFIIIWVVIGDIYWYKLYPNCKTFPSLIFIALWPFLTLAAFVHLLVKRRGGDEEDEQ